MKNIFILLTLTFHTMMAFSQKNSFGIINYTAPSGYELINNENVLTYYKEDKSTGAYCNIFIYKIMPGHGSVQQDFDFAWINLMQAPFKFTSQANMQPAAVLKGWQFLMGTTIYSDNGVKTMAMLTSFSGENTMQNVCILSNSDSYKTDIENFIASVDVSKDISAQTTTQNTDTAVTNNTTQTDTINDTGNKSFYSIVTPPTWSLNATGNSLMLEKNVRDGKRVIEFMNMIQSTGDLAKDMEHIFFEVFDGWQLHNSPTNSLFENATNEKGLTCQGLNYYMLSNSISKKGMQNGDVITATILLVQVGDKVAIINATDNILGSEVQMALNFLLYNLKIKGIADKNLDYKKQLIGTWGNSSGTVNNNLKFVTSYTADGKYYTLSESSYTVGYDYYYDLIKHKQFKSSGSFNFNKNVLERKFSSGGMSKYFIRFFSTKYGNFEWKNNMNLYEVDYDKTRINSYTYFQKID